MKRLLYFSATALALLACSDDNSNDFKFDLGSGLAAGFMDFNIDFSEPVIYSYASEAEKDKILAEVHQEIYQTNDPYIQAYTVDIRVNPNNNTITVKVEAI